MSTSIKAKCRRKILDAATEFSPTGKTYSKRHINQAVAVCRANNLVKPDVLRMAGFNAKGSRG